VALCRHGPPSSRVDNVTSETANVDELNLRRAGEAFSGVTDGVAALYRGSFEIASLSSWILVGLAQDRENRRGRRLRLRCSRWRAGSAGRGWILAQMMGEAEPIHLAGHDDVREHEVDAVVLKLAQRRFGIGDAADAVAELLQQADADSRDLGIILDQQHCATAAERRCLCRFRTGASVPRGNRMVKVVPLPSSLATFTVPPAWCAKPCTWDRPRPVPLPIGLVVKNGFENLVDDVGGNPEPGVGDVDRDEFAGRQRLVQRGRCGR